MTKVAPAPDDDDDDKVEKTIVEPFSPGSYSQVSQEDVSTASTDQTETEPEIVGIHGDHLIPKRPKTPLRVKIWNAFDVVLGLAVVANAAVIALETDYGDLHPATFRQVEDIFTVIFVFEIAVRFIVAGPRKYFSDFFNWFDVVLVSFSMADAWYLSQGMQFVLMAGTPPIADWWRGLVGLPVQTSSSGAMLSFMATLRIFRLLRLVRLIRMMTRFKELTLLLTGFAGSLKTVFWSMLFLFIICFSFSLVFVKAFHRRGVEYNFGDFDAYHYFGTVPNSMATLSICMTDGCVESVIRPITEKEPWAFLVWAVFLTITLIGIMNMIVGILCETVSKSAEAEALETDIRERTYQKKVLTAVTDIFRDIDEDNSGLLDREEFAQAVFTNPSVQEGFLLLGLDDEENLFDTLDADKSGQVSFQEWIDGVSLILAGKRPAKAGDMSATFLAVKALCKMVEAAEEDDAYIREMLTESRAVFFSGAE